MFYVQFSGTSTFPPNALPSATVLSNSSRSQDLVVSGMAPMPVNRDSIEERQCGPEINGNRPAAASFILVRGV